MSSIRKKDIERICGVISHEECLFPKIDRDVTTYYEDITSKISDIELMQFDSVQELKTKILRDIKYGAEISSLVELISRMTFKYKTNDVNDKGSGLDEQDIPEHIYVF